VARQINLSESEGGLCRRDARQQQKGQDEEASAFSKAQSGSASFGASRVDDPEFLLE
jgi:hypothetical protein